MPLPYVPCCTSLVNLPIIHWFIHDPLLCHGAGRLFPVRPVAARRPTPANRKFPCPKRGIPRETIFGLQPTLRRHANDQVRKRPKG